MTECLKDEGMVAVYRERVHLFSQHIGGGSGVGEGSFISMKAKKALGRNKMLAIQENFKYPLLLVGQSLTAPQPSCPAPYLQS